MADRVEASASGRWRKRVRMGLIRTSRQLRHHRWHGEVAAGAILIAALLARATAGGAFNTVPFITVFPAIVLATLVWWSGRGRCRCHVGWYRKLVLSA